MEEVLGVDVGGVIIDRVNDGTDTSFFGHNFLQTTAVPDVFDVLKSLSGRFSKIVVVSKCGQRIQEQTLKWLDHQEFYQRTGILKSDVHFCRERRDKAGICERLGVTHFVDDRLEVLGYLTTVSNLYLFRPSDNEVRKFARFLPRVKRVETWREVASDLIS